MTNEELTELCTRVATKVLGWEERKLYKAARVYGKWENPDNWVPIPLPKPDMDHSYMCRFKIKELISPWGRDLVEKAMLENKFEWDCHCHPDLGGAEYQYAFFPFEYDPDGGVTIDWGKESVAYDKDKNIACLLAADKAVSDDN